ncbi:hypothetical protein [Streptomyces sp. NRRL S-920]|uniref:hypothetical protein n=1 Tax=Streptomyces sp. NRRL S-920 TaxID=1463921 RepID=UPI0006904481|nr:hypothetical protein [Streptomyces sp. NRRL S-920]
MALTTERTADRIAERTADRTAEPVTGRAPERPTGRRDTDGMAVASFVCGLLGLLVLNIFLGPVAIVLAGLALRRGTARRGRALLGLGLGVADLVVLASLVAMDNTVSWGVAG